MELIPLLIFAVIAFNIFKGIIKSSGTKSAQPNMNTSAKDLMQRLNQQIEQSNRGSTNKTRYRDSSPTQRGRESLQRKNQSSPWGEGVTFSSGEDRKPLNIKIKSDRKASHKSPIQHGRRGRNMDQNRNRTDEWGSRGDGGLLNGKTLAVLLVLGGAILYALSRMPAG